MALELGLPVEDLFPCQDYLTMIGTFASLFLDGFHCLSCLLGDLIHLYCAVDDTLTVARAPSIRIKSQRMHPTHMPTQ